MGWRAHWEGHVGSRTQRTSPGLESVSMLLSGKWIFCLQDMSDCLGALNKLKAHKEANDLRMQHITAFQEWFVNHWSYFQKKNKLMAWTHTHSGWQPRKRMSLTSKAQLAEFKRSQIMLYSLFLILIALEWTHVPRVGSSISVSTWSCITTQRSRPSCRCSSPAWKSHPR